MLYVVFIRYYSDIIYSSSISYDVSVGFEGLERSMSLYRKMRFNSSNFIFKTKEQMTDNVTCLLKSHGFVLLSTFLFEHLFPVLPLLYSLSVYPAGWVSWLV